MVVTSKVADLQSIQREIRHGTSEDGEDDALDCASQGTGAQVTSHCINPKAVLYVSSTPEFPYHGKAPSIREVDSSSTYLFINSRL